MAVTETGGIIEAAAEMRERRWADVIAGIGRTGKLNDAAYSAVARLGAALWEHEQAEQVLEAIDRLLRRSNNCGLPYTRIREWETLVGLIRAATPDGRMFT